MTRIIENLAEVSDRYDALLVDLWGCLHNGIEAFPEAVAALQGFVSRGGTVLLLTNAPRPRLGVEKQLALMNVPDDCWHTITTSGDSARAAMFRGAVGSKVYFIGEDRDQVADFYLIVERYGPTYGNALMAFANRLIPPNVFYIEVPFEDRRVRAKYAIVSLGHLEVLVAPQTLQPYFWARFSQPMRLLSVRDEAGRQRLVEVLSRAAATTAS